MLWVWEIPSPSSASPPVFPSTAYPAAKVPYWEDCVGTTPGNRARFTEGCTSR